MRRNERATHAAAAGAALHGLVVEMVRRVPRTMSMTSVSTLHTLDETGPRRITDLAIIEGVTQPSMTTLVKVLERDGMVERREDPSDGRVALVTLTKAGTAFVRERRRANVEAFAQLIDKLTDEDAAALAAAIPALEHLRALSEESSRASGPVTPPRLDEDGNQRYRWTPS
jgi:DNA-binding MarR family transcriptional regulator